MKTNEISIRIFYKYKEKIRHLQEESYLISFDNDRSSAIEYSKEKNTSLESNLKEENCYLNGVFIEDNLVGFIWYFDYEYMAKKRLHINQIVIDSRYRRQGLATILITSVEKKAVELGINQIDLNVTATNKNAINLYSKMRFKNDRILMFKEIT